MTSVALRPGWLAHGGPQVLRSAGRAVLRVPLLAKLLGANLLFLVGAFAAHTLLPWESVEVALAVALLFGFAATALLVWLALRPIAELEATAERVSDGDFNARVPANPLADRSLSRLSTTLNRLLEHIAADRARIQYLAGRSVRARDIERESVARELRDSFAQTLSAIALQLEAARRTNTDTKVDEQLECTRELVRQLNDDMRGVAEALYPGTLTEFGLRNSIEALGRRVARRSHLQLEIDTDEFTATLTPQSAAALYRVADEALRNVEQHANAMVACVVLQSDDVETVLEIEDDGCGIDMKSSDPLQAGLGLFSAKAVLALAGGQLQISSAPGRGTRVTARVPREEL